MSTSGIKGQLLEVNGMFPLRAPSSSGFLFVFSGFALIFFNFEVSDLSLCLFMKLLRCNKLKDTEWISRQDLYVCVDYVQS